MYKSDNCVLRRHWSIDKKTVSYPIKGNPPMTCRKRALKQELLNHYNLFIIPGTRSRFIIGGDLLLKY